MKNQVLEAGELVITITDQHLVMLRNAVLGRKAEARGTGGWSESASVAVMTDSIYSLLQGRGKLGTDRCISIKEDVLA